MRALLLLQEDECRGVLLHGCMQKLISEAKSENQGSVANFDLGAKSENRVSAIDGLRKNYRMLPTTITHDSIEE